MRRMVYGTFAILLVALLITTFWVTSLHNQYMLGMGPDYQRKTVSLEDYLSPYVSGEITISANPIFYQHRTEYVTVNGTFLTQSGSPLNISVREMMLTIMTVPDPDDMWDVVYSNYNFLELFNTTGFSMYDAYKISIGSLGNHSLGFGIDLAFPNGTSSSKVSFLGQLDILSIFVFPGFLWPDFWYLTTGVMIIIGCVLLVHAILKWLEIID